MVGFNQGIASYPGVISWESLSITDVSGISPSIALLTMFPQNDLPNGNGDLVLTYNDSVITFQNMHVDAISYQRGSGGKVVTLRLLDERWAWADANISLRANIRLPNSFVDPNHERTPQQLASACFNALGVQIFDVSNLPNDARPDVDWDHANPAQELAKLCDDLGCRLVPVRSVGGWQIVVTGVGNNLPDQYPFNDAGAGIDPKETPDYIKIVSAPIQYQFAAPLSVVVKDQNLAWAELTPKTYAFRNVTNDETTLFGYAYESMNNFETVDPTRFRLPDGTILSDQELARQSVLRCWRIEDDNPYQEAAGDSSIPPDVSEASITVPGYDSKVFRKQIMLAGSLVQSFTDAYGEEHKRPAFVFGLYRGNNSTDGNYPFGRRVDAQQAARSDQLSLEEQESFSLAADPIDSDKSIITLSKPMIRVTNPSAVKSKSDAVIYGPAYLWYMCAVQIRDLDSWQPVRNEFFYQIGNGTNKDFCLEVVKNDIQPWYIANYPGLATSASASSTLSQLPKPVLTNNYDQVQKQSLYYAQSIAQTFQTVLTQTRTYIGLFQIDLDGVIQQVTYRIGNDGSSTIASQGTEHNFDIPDYWTRRQREGTRGLQDKLQLQKEIQDQRDSLKGTYNT